jgi:hypothetical protein
MGPCDNCKGSLARGYIIICANGKGETLCSKCSHEKMIRSLVAKDGGPLREALRGIMMDEGLI